MKNSINRIANVVVGSGLIVTTMTASTAPLGALAILPLIGAALVLVGVSGESPLSGTERTIAGKASNLVNGASHVRAHAV
ncbi:hypothetical protein [Kaarinaea lacus]